MVKIISLSNLSEFKAKCDENYRLYRHDLAIGLGTSNIGNLQISIYSSKATAYTTQRILELVNDVFGGIDDYVIREHGHFSYDNGDSFGYTYSIEVQGTTAAPTLNISFVNLANSIPSLSNIELEITSVYDNVLEV